MYESSHGTINDKDNGPIMNSGEFKNALFFVVWAFCGLRVIIPEDRD